jgi:type I restriction enzyme S subunit
MKAGWVTRKLGDVCEIERGGSPRPIDSFLTNAPDGVNWIKIGDTKNVTKYITKTEEKIRPEGARHSRMVFAGDFILSNSMSFGRPYIMKTTGCIHDGWLVLREREPKINQDYLYHVLGSDLVFRQFDRLAAGSTVRNLNISLVQGVEIPIPPLPEQRRIVGILDEAFDGIATAKANAQKNLQNARALFESHLQAVFTQRGEGWERVALNVLLERGWIESHLDGNHGSDYPRKEEFISEGVPYISANCLDDDRVDMARAKYLSSSRAALLHKGIAKDNDVLFAHNATVGPVAILRTDEAKVILSTSLTYYRCNPKHILPAYLAHYMRSFAFKTQYLSVMRQSTRNQVPITTQREFYHVIPPVHEQKAVIGQLDGLFDMVPRLESIYQQKLAALEALKKSLLDQAFTGLL